MQSSLPSTWLLVSALLVLIASFVAWRQAHQTPLVQEDAYWVVFPDPPIDDSFRDLRDQLDTAQKWVIQDRVEEARQSFEEVLAQLDQSEGSPDVLRARAMDGLGLVARAYGDYYWALQQHREARKVYRQEGLWMLEANNLEYLAATYRSLGADELAEDHWDQALEAQPVPWRKAIILMELATQDSLRGDYEAAAENLPFAFQRRMAGCEQSDEDKLMGKSEVLDRWAGAAMFMGDFETAIRASTSSVAILEKLGYSRELPIARSNLGVIYHQAGQFQEALRHLDVALGALPQGRYPHERAILHFRRAQSLRALERTTEAIEALETSLAWSESVQQTTATTALRSAFASRHHVFHDELVDLLLQQHVITDDPATAVKAWQVASSVRARDLIQRIQAEVDGKADGSTTSSPQHALRKASRRLEHQLLQLKEKVNADSIDPALAETAVADLERRQRDLVLQLQTLEASADPPSQLAPQTAVTPQEPVWPDLDEFRDLLDDDTVVLQFFLGTQRSAVWWLDRQGLTVYPLPPQGELQTKVVQVFEDLANSDQAIGAIEAESRQQRLEDLSQTLLGDLAHRLENQRLVFLVDGALHLLPFAALLHPLEGHALVRRHRMAYLPSLGSLQALRQRQGPKVPLHSATVVADPLYHSEGREETRQHLPSQQILGLPYSRREAEAIRHGLGPGGSGAFFLGADARQEVLADSKRPQSALIHLSLHGQLNVDRPEFSHLVFASWDDAGQPVDGRLYVHEVAELDLSSQLLVLSACNTARGNIVSGEGLVGMPYTVLGAGAQRALVSLWFVDDEATALLMEAFYALLLEQRLPPDEALRQAQDDLRSGHDEHWSAPYHWAGFVLYGDWLWPYSTSQPHS